MFHTDDAIVREWLLQGDFGLERENLRITGDGFLAETPNPFEYNPHIVRDFAEQQVEINTGIQKTPGEAIAELARYDTMVQTKLASMTPREYLWPFSNPPYLRNENDVTLARFEGVEAHKTAYREYLSERYGRYKMTFSGIHLNYSFSNELLERDFALSEYAEKEGSRDERFSQYKAQLYLKLAEQCVSFGWLMSAITAASPLMDSSFVEQGRMGGDLYFGLGTVRCSELGYWNYFSPVLDYSSMPAYAASIKKYIDKGFIAYPSELYYPIRVKPRGVYNLENLAHGEVSHIELRMFDLNPLYPVGLNEDDVYFAQLLLTWLACTQEAPLTESDQIQAIQNFKNAAHYDLRTVKITTPCQKTYSVSQAALHILDCMKEFYRNIAAGETVARCLDYQRGKFRDSVNERYTHVIRREYANGFVAKGLELARQRQREALKRKEAGEE